MPATFGFVSDKLRNNPVFHRIRDGSASMGAARRWLDRGPSHWAERINLASLERHVAKLHGTVVDLGCGTAPYKTRILEFADSYIGVDWPGSQHANTAVDVFADINERVPLPDASADCITSFQAMEHLHRPDQMLREAARILRPGGVILITTPFLWHVHEGPHDFFRYTLHGLEKLLTNAGFVDIDIRPTTGFWTTAELRWAYQSSRLFRGPLRASAQGLWEASFWLARRMDELDPQPEHTASYVSFARKPG